MNSYDWYDNKQTKITDNIGDKDDENNNETN